MKKVTITTRAVYHKIASVTIEVPSHISEDELQDWLWRNEGLYVDQLDEELSNADYDFGFGLDEYNGMEWLHEESETRFDLIENNEITFGGHI